MKKFFTSISLVALALGANAQTLEIRLPGGAEDVSGTMIEVVSGSFEISQEFEVKNVSGGALDLRIVRVKLEKLAGTKDYICWGGSALDGNCYPASDVSVVDPYITPDAANIADGDNGWMIVYHVPEDIAGCASYRYFVIDPADTKLDSIDVQFCSTLSVEKQEKLFLSVFPNPAANYINIELSNANSANLKVQLFNIVGEIVLEREITSGINKFSVATLPNGVYFYSILTNQNVLETKKIVIKH